MRLSNKARLLIVIQISVGFAMALSNVFVNLYLFKLTSLFDTTLYNMCSYITWVVMFWVGGVIVRKKDYSLCIKLCILSYGLQYLGIALLGNKIADYYFLIGMFQGGANSLYFFTINSLVYHFTTNENRPYYFGVSGALGSVPGMVTPFLTGLIINGMSGNRGYILTFIIMVAVFAITLVISARLPEIKPENANKAPAVMKKSGVKPWNRIILSSIMTGLREGITAMATTVVLYEALNNSEFFVGTYSSIFTIIGFISTYLLGTLINENNQKKLFMFGASVSLLAGMFLLFPLNFVTIFIYGAVITLCGPFTNITFISIMYRFIDYSIKEDEDISDYMVARETYINLGRIFIMLITLLLGTLTNFQVVVRYLLAAVSATQLCTYLFIFHNNEYVVKNHVQTVNSCSDNA